MQGGLRRGVILELLRANLWYHRRSYEHSARIIKKKRYDGRLKISLSSEIHVRQLENLIYGLHSFSWFLLNWPCCPLVGLEEIRLSARHSNLFGSLNLLAGCWSPQLCLCLRGGGSSHDGR